MAQPYGGTSTLEHRREQILVGDKSAVLSDAIPIGQLCVDIATWDVFTRFAQAYINRVWVDTTVRERTVSFLAIWLELSYS